MIKLRTLLQTSTVSLPRYHRQRGLVAWALLVSTLSVTCASTSQSGPDTKVKTVLLSRVVRIPVTNLSASAGGAQPIKTLLVSEGGTDEPPEGTSAFDVFDDGSLVLADPLRTRLVVFTAKGAFKRELSIGIAADDVTITPDRVIHVRDASTGETRFFDAEGRPHEGQGHLQRAVPKAGEARLVTEEGGTVTRFVDGAQSTLHVKFERPGLRLLSIQVLAIDQDGDTYVALEATPGGDTVNVSKYVQKYSADGKLACEVENIPLDYYVSPVNELRVRKGTLYQLRTTRSEIQINEWDLH